MSNVSKNQAIYNLVSTDEQVQEQDTLIYNIRDGFTWVRLVSGYSAWNAYASSAPEAEEEARAAGLDPIRT
jgi:hypothetical protein